MGKIPYTEDDMSYPQTSNQNQTSKMRSQPHKKTIKFFAKTLIEFLSRQRPASNRAKPAFIKNTRAPANNSQIFCIKLKFFAALGTSVPETSAKAVWQTIKTT